MTSDQLAECLRILSVCEASPSNPQAEIVARWVRQTLDRPPADPLADRMRDLLSAHALAIVDGDQQRRRETVQAIRQAIAAASVPSSDARH